MTVRLWIAALLLLTLAGCSIKGGGVWVEKPESVGPFEAAVMLGCGANESESRCLERVRGMAEERLKERLEATIQKIVTEFVRENGLGDEEVAEWLYGNIATETLERLLSRAQRQGFYQKSGKTHMLLGVSSKEARPIVKQAIIRAVKSDELLYAQAKMIRAFEGLESLLDRY